MRRVSLSRSQRADRAISSTPDYIVKASAIHGKGVFARRKIPAGSCIIEYEGERIDWAEAERRAEEKGKPINHTFYFSLHDGRVIDGGSHGNEARFINHACEPNCEAIEHEDGRVYIYALRPIERGEELSYSYALIYEGRHTPSIKKAFACHCSASTCTGIYLAPKRRGKRT